MRDRGAPGRVHGCFLLAAADTSAHIETRVLVEREYPLVAWPTMDREGYLAADRHRSLIDCSQARDVLGWEARHSWRDAVDVHVEERRA